ncbi:MAG: MFS transporter [Chloroflexi bacterium]|nr:MFS transporter [Chloroflexota bacterium]
MTSRRPALAVRVASAYTLARRPGGTIHESFAPLASPGFRTLWISTFAWNVARWMEMTITSWTALQLTGSPWLVGMVAVARAAALPVSGPIMGALSDRIDRLQMIRSSGCVNVIVMASVAASLVAGHGAYWQLLLGCLWLGASWGIDWPVRRSLLPEYVGPERVLPAIVLDNVAFNVARVAGPLIAGAALEAWGAAGAYVVLTISFLVASLSAWTLASPPARTVPVRVPGSAPPHRPSLWSDLRDGFDYVRADPVVSGVIIISLVMNILLYPYDSMLSVFADGVLHVGPVELGALGAATGVGAACSVFLQPLFRSTRAQGLAFIIGSIVGGVALVLFSVSSGYVVALILLFVVGAGTSSFGTMQSSIILSRCSPAMRGRALGLVTLAIGSAPIGSLQLGFLADTVGVSLAIGISSALSLVLVIVVGMHFGMFGRNLVGVPVRAGESPSPAAGGLPHDGGATPDGVVDASPKRGMKTPDGVAADNPDVTATQVR